MDLNLSKSVMDLMFWGRLFHNFGQWDVRSSPPKKKYIFFGLGRFWAESTSAYTENTLVLYIYKCVFKIQKFMQTVVSVTVL